MSKKESKEFVSNVTGEQWSKHNSAKWSGVINHVAVLLEDVVHKGKNGTTKMLPKGSEVFIDDIRGRIKPQYRVRDETGKIWFISVTQLEIKDSDVRISEEDLTFKYRGGVRHDGGALTNQRHTVTKTTEDELRERKK